MAFCTVHTVSIRGRVAQHLEGAAPLPGVYDTKAEAIEAGRAQAESLQTEHVIHSDDGTIVERHSYAPS